MPKNFPVFKGYRLVENISQFELGSAWIAIRKVDDQECFLKLYPESVLANIQVRQILERGLALQSWLNHKTFVRSRLTTTESGFTICEYPRLSPTEWKSLDQLDLSDLACALFPVASAVDLIHMQGLVHGDMKQEHLFVSQVGSRIAVRIIDFDFLSCSGDSTNGLVVGTPGLLSPRVIESGTMQRGDDLYALGVSLKRRLESFVKNDSTQHSYAMCLKVADVLIENGIERRPTTFLQILKNVQEGKHRDPSCFTRNLLLRHVSLQLKRASSVSLRERTKQHAFLTRQCGVIGFAPEHIDVLVQLFAQSATKAMRVFSRVLLRSHVEILYNVFVVQIPDGVRSYLYSTVQISTNAHPVVTSARKRGALSSSGDVLSEREFLNIISETELTQRPLDEIECRALATAAKRLGRKNQSIQFLQQLLKTLRRTDSKVHEVRLDLATALLQSGRIDDAAATLEQSSGVLGMDEEIGVRYLRIRGWIASLRQDWPNAVRDFRDASEKAKRLRLHLEHALAQYASGTASWRQGDPHIALLVYEKTLKLVRRHGLKQGTTAIYTSAGLVATELAQYEASMEYCQSGIRQCIASDNLSNYSNLLLPLILAKVRHARFDEAAELLANYLPAGNWEKASEHFCAYLLAQSFMEIQASNLLRAADWLNQANLLLDKVTPKMASKYYHQCAEKALMEGRKSDLDALSSYKERMSDSDDVSHVAEFSLLLAVSSFVYSECELHVPHQIESATIGCFEAKAYYYSCLGYYLLLCKDESKLHKSSFIKLRQWIRSADAGVPLFHSLQVLLAECEDNKPAEMKSWKKCLTILRDGKQHFAAAMTALHIAQRYLLVAMPRHAQSMAAQGQTFARNLGNTTLIRKFADVDEQASKRQVTASSPAFVEAISEALSNLDKTELTAQRLLELAIETSGAERGIILLASTSGEMRIVAEAHCDDDAVEIAKYSKQLVESSAHNSSPILIDDATADSRTSGYRSIIQHNIQSIAAIPMRRDEELLGVLYLDHHSQPSLFSADDLRILSGIGDLILSVLLSTQKMGGLIRAAQVKRERVTQDQTPYIFATSSSSLKSMLREVEKVADSDIAILISGESGTGKEVLARFVHESSKRKDAPLVIVNSAALTPELVESELFGITKGTATGVLARDGKISAADQGTLFLDEIGDMPRNLQSKLLRVLETNRIERVGSTKSEFVDFRLVAATNRNLKAMIAEGTFREDLYYRISKYVVHLPPLRERRAEIEYLVQRLMIRIPAHKRFQFDEQAMEALKSYAWPGNVRELWNLIERIAIVHGNRTIGVELLPEEMKSKLNSYSPGKLLHHSHQKAILEAELERNHWSVSKTARALKIPLTTLRRILDELGIKRRR